MKHNPRLSLYSCVAALVLGLGSAPTASAILITPTGTSFGSLPDGAFGGSGIPVNAVEKTIIGTLTGTLTLGLSATQRYANPAVTNNGAGTFFAAVGGDTLDSAPTLARWNFDFYVNGLSNGQYVSLFYDNNAAVGNDVTNSSLIPFDYHDSTNLGYGGGFNPNAVGEYGFALVAYDSAHVELGRSAILVEVNAVPDSGSTSLMLGGALVVGILFRRRAARK